MSEERAGVPTSDDVPKLVLGALLMMVWAIMVDAISASEVVFADGSCLSTKVLYAYNIAALAIALWAGWLATRARAAEMVASFVGASDPGEPAERRSGKSLRALLGPAGRAALSPWVPVTGMFLLAGWLIYRSGGTLASPYAPVPLVMMAVGQSVYETPTLRFRRDAGLSNAPILLRDVVVHYRYPIFLFAVAEIGPIVLGAPAARPAPQGMTVFTSMLAIVICMAVAAASRWRDQKP